MSRPLDGVKVLETGDAIATAYAGKLLADLGADVARANPPGLPPDLPERVRAYRETLGAFLHRGKREVTGPLADLAQDADILLLMAPLQDLQAQGLDPGALADAGKIAICITPFGLTEAPPPAPLTDFLYQAMGGFVLLTGRADQPPTRNQASLPQFQAGIIGTIGGLGALLAREAGGSGEVVDVSLYESVVFLWEREDVLYTHTGQLWRRTARHKIVHPFIILPCKDGYVSLCVASPMQFRGLCELIGHPEFPDEPGVLLSTIVHADRIDEMLLPWLAERGKYEIVALTQERRIPSSPMLGFDELLHDEHMLARDFLQTLDLAGREVTMPGMPYHFH